MTDTEIRERAEAYISQTVAEHEDSPSDEDLKGAIERVEAATRELLAVRVERRQDALAC
jgi:hypothetical protein